MPQCAAINSFVIERGSIFLPCVKNIEKLSHPLRHKMICVMDIFAKKFTTHNLQLNNSLLLNHSE